MEKHVTAVAIIKIGMSILWILIALIVFVVLITVGTAVSVDDAEAQTVLYIVGVLVPFVLIIISIPGIIGGIGLLRRRQWARILVLILSVIDLVNIPIGTAIGVYSIWALIQDETVQLFTPAGASNL